jgi:hypothetical protein
VEIVPPTQADVVDPSDTPADVGQLDMTERIELEAELDAEAPAATASQPLAPTGRNEAPLIVIGLLVLLTGVIVIMLGPARATKD